MAYRADIEIAVRGAQDLKRLQNQIKTSSDAVNSLNSSLNGVANLLTRSFNNINKVVGEAADNLNKAALGTKEASDAARDYYEANKTLNNALRERLKLLGDIQRAERGTVLANIKASQAARAESGFSAFSAGIDIPTQKSIRRNREKRALAEAAAETANQIQKLADRQEEFTLRTDDAAQAAARQTAAFYRQLRVAKEVAKINATAGPAQLLLAPAAPGSPAMSGGARRRITGPVERLGGARTADEAVATLRLAEATDVLARNTKKIDPQYNRFLPDTATLNATSRGIQRLTTDQENFDETIRRGIRFTERYNQELERRRRLGIDGPVSNRMPGATGVTGGPFPVEGPIPLSQFGRRAPAPRPPVRGGANRIGGAISGSIIGGAFPLLFGQGGGAAAGGAIGGLVGGLAGPGGSFAGSLLGTLLGDIASRGQSVKQLGEDLGFSATQAKTLADAFKSANTDVEKFTAVIQNIRGVGLELEEQATAVQLITALTEKYGGSFEKVGNAVTSALESGKVNQAVLNQLTSQGITVQDALAAKYDVSRDKILEMAKKGEISVQSLLDTLVELGNASTTAAEKTQTPFEKALSTTGQLFQGFWKDVQAIFAGVSSNGVEAGTALLNIFNKILQEALIPLGRFLARIAALLIDVMSTGVRAATELINGFRGAVSVIGDTLTGIVNMIPGLRTIVNLARQLFKGATGSRSSDLNDMPWPEGIPKPGSPGMIGRILAPSQADPSGGTSAGAKPPEDRTAQLLDDLQAMRLISITQDGIRDAMFEGNLELVARLQYEQKIADITRDTSKALRNANYESEKAAILAQEAARLKDAELEREDMQRAIVSQRFQDELRAQEAVRNSIKPFTDLIQQQELQAQYTQTYLRLVTEGMLPAEAERIANFEQLVTQQTAAVAEQLKITEAAIIEAKARGASTVELEEQLAILKGQQTAIQEQASRGPGEGPTQEQLAAEAIAQLRGELNLLTDPINAAVTGANAIGSAFQQAFQGLATGAMSAQEALASFFKSVGEAFVSMAAEIIAKQLVMITLQTILKALGFAGGAGGGGGTPSYASGNVATNAFQSTDVLGLSTSISNYQFAEGGFVTGPTRALIGEGGEPEYVIPASKMSAAMSRYSAGARGASVIPGSGASGGGGSADAGAAVVDVRYTVERINSVDYVTADQFQAGMQQAAAQGAAEGQRQTLRRLQQSPSTRRRVGI